MKAGIIGGGAIGLLFAAYLSRNHQLTLYTNTEAQASKIRQQGIAVCKDGETEISYPHASSSRHYEEKLLIVTVKQFHLPSILDHLSSEEPKTLLFLQNGMGHIKSLSDLKGHLIYTGSVSHGAVKNGERDVQHNGIGTTVFSPFQEGSSSEIIESLSTEDFPFVFRSDWYEVVAGKLLVNACINPLTGLLNVRNGQLTENPHYYLLLKQVFDEVFPVLEVGDEASQWKKVEDVCRATSSNISSMLQDLRMGRKTEIEAIAGYVLDLAEDKNRRAPTLSFLTNAIKGMENS
ncbi:2-dehydropantoate 2-reductase [Metabacillus sp. KIGAM252]|uniref:2-dehydropantoate 2-reductase n=1 Tax=Metabacillus flavus TaxID=2823519 RepID=A0ABS5LDR4_9BACI|nr:2-dehydropantoate 2-reductase [Metabacillus flavus]MBS2968867.1 2-dehydropantoate 2-reductase [Metabacillus flavus]